MSLLLLGCTVIIYKKNPSNKYDCEILTTIFIDSLREDNIDTILYFSNKCCGCGESDTPYTQCRGKVGLNMCEECWEP